MGLLSSKFEGAFGMSGDPGISQKANTCPATGVTCEDNCPDGPAVSGIVGRAIARLGFEDVVCNYVEELPPTSP